MGVGCPHLQPCPVHQRASAARRGYGRRWRVWRQVILARDPVCRWPGCTAPSTDVDHIVPKAAGGSDLETNLRGLCHSHHSAVTARGTRS
jgi:5-methylcytosine-specific restriction protein A